MMYFNLSDCPRKTVRNTTTVKDKFDDYFTVRRNTIYEGAKFNRRRQGEKESVDEFITNLYALAKYCQYGELQDELIRDRIVVGIQDAQLSEKMQMEPELTLERTVTLACQSECVKTQQSTVRRELLQESTIEVVKGTRQQKGHNRLPSAQSNQPPSQKAKKLCGRCGRPGPTVKLSAQPENPLATHVASLDISSQYVEAHLKDQASEQ